MALDIENLDQLQDLSNKLRNDERTEARLADLAMRRVLGDAEEKAIGEAMLRPEHKEGTSIAYTYDSYISHADSFEWTPGEWVSGRRGGTTRPYGNYGPAFHDPGTSGYWDVRPEFNLALDIKSGERMYDTDLYGLVKSISIKRFTEKVRQDIEQTAPTMLQIVGLENGLEIINPYDLQSWMIRAGVAARKRDLPIKILVEPPLKPELVNEPDRPVGNDNLEEIVNQLFAEPENLTLDTGILNHPDIGTPRGVIKQFSGDNVDTIDDERIKNLIEIRDQWKDAQIVETESLVGDKSRYVALILPEPGNEDGTVKEWAIAENPQVGNALFVVNPHQLADGMNWRDVLIETSKKTALGNGAIKKVHTPDGKWKDRIIDMITSPSR